MHILAAYPHSPALQANYVVSWKISPYLGMDLLVPPLTQFMSIYTAGRLFLCLCLALFVLGTAAIHAALFRRLSLWPVASALFAYSYVFSLGFANYLFGVGIWLLAFAGWILLSGGPIRWRILGGSVLSLAVFFVHFFAFFGYGLCVATFELGKWLNARDRKLTMLFGQLLTAGSTAVLPLIIFVSCLKAQDGGITQYGSLGSKVTVLLSPVAFPGARFDLAILAVAGCLIGVGLLRGSLRLARAMYLPLIALTVASVAMPNWLSGVWGTDYRFPVVVVYLLIAGTAWQPAPARVLVPSAIVLVVLLIANLGSIILAWRPIGADDEALRTALNVIDQGARVIAFRDDAGIDPTLRRGPLYIYTQMPALAVIERDAYLPFLFKNPMDPVEAAPGLKLIDAPHGHAISLTQLRQGADPVTGPQMLGTTENDGHRNFWGDWPRHYDYAIELSFGAKADLPRQLNLLVSGRIFNIYRVQQ
jgi:hypothetical protein